MHNPPATIELAEDFRFPPVGVKLHAVSFDFCVEVPVVFHPSGVAHQVNGDVARLEVAVGEIIGKELVYALHLIPAVGVSHRRDGGHIFRIPPHASSQADVAGIERPGVVRNLFASSPQTYRCLLTKVRAAGGALLQNGRRRGGSCDTVLSKESAMLTWLIRLWRKIENRLHRRRPLSDTYRPSNLHGRVR